MRRDYLILLFVGIVAFCVQNSYVVPDIMESRNLITAREMVQDGHWIVPTMNGELRLEKPPLPTWIAAGVFAVFGDSWTAQRIPAGLMGILALFFLYRIALCLQGDRCYALFSALVLATSLNFVLAARTASWDIYCHTFMLGSILCLLSPGKYPARSALFGGILFGLSFMSKGPVSVYALFLPFLLAVLLVRRRPIRLSNIIVFVLAALVVGGAWYLYIWYFQATAGSAVLDKESGSWFHRNVRPWYYYVTFFLETGIWAPLCLLALVFPYWDRKVPDRSAYRLSLLWMALSVVLLSFLPEKKNRYLLPVLLPAALTMGQLLLSLRWNSRRIVTIVVVLFACVELFGMPFLARFFSNSDYSCPKVMLCQKSLDLPAYSLSQDSLRIELVYDMGRTVRFLSAEELQQVPRPYLLVVPDDTKEPQLSAQLRPAQPLGHFDGNRQSPRTRGGRACLRYTLFKVNPPK